LEKITNCKDYEYKQAKIAGSNRRKSRACCGFCRDGQATEWPYGLGASKRAICGMSIMEFDVELDARQLSCPLPILRTKKILSQMQGGQVLKVVATDKKSPDDFTDFCKQTGNDLLSAAQQGDEFIFYLRRRQA
jgi:tRNA 2-thiouridine synthesizing protein A